MKNIPTLIHKISSKKSLPRLFTYITLGTFSASLFCDSALAEGTYQLGPNNNNQSYQALFEYDSNYALADSGLVPAINRPMYVDITTAGEVINISACGFNFSDDWEVDIYYVGADIADLSSGNRTNLPTGGTLKFGQVGSAATTDSNYRTQGSFGTSTNNSDCRNHSQLTTIASSGGGRTVKYTTDTAGVYEIRLYNRSQSGTNGVFRQFDVSVTPNTSTAPNPTANSGRLWSFLWGFRTGTFGQDGVANGSYYIRVPGGFPGTNYVWELDLNNFSGNAYEIVANNKGVDSPNAAGNPVAGLSVDIAGNSVSPQYRQYLSYPANNVNPEPTSGSVVIIENFRFEDSQGVDNTISPDVTTGIQDTGNFKFTTNVDGTYVIIIDIDDDGNEANGFNPDGIYGVGDVFLRGATTAGSELVVPWNGKTNLGSTIPDGSYQASLQAIVGEYHFVAADVETSGGSSFGLTINKAISTANSSPTLVYWDDITGLGNPPGATTSLPNGLLGGGSNGHQWGSFGAGSIGDLNYLDTYVYGKFTVANTPAIILNSGTNPDAPNLDFGDAPDTYSTNKTPNNDGVNNNDSIGASHNFNPINPDIYLGDNPPDGESDAQTPLDSTGDDSAGNTPDDENSVANFPALETDATNYGVTVKVNNNTGKNAYLVGWLDFDRNGTFDDDEGVRQVISSDVSAQNISLSWSNVDNLGLSAGDTYARFRISTDSNLETTTPGGGFIDGEVEDYSVAIVAAAVTNPNVLLAKRITAVRRDGAILAAAERSGGQETSTFNDYVNDSDPKATEDNDANWPDPDDIYLRGALDGGQIKSGDEVEYTVYFLNNGSADAENVTLCDVVPDNMTYVPGSMELFWDNSAPLDNPTKPNAGTYLNATDGLTDSYKDGDRGAYFPAGVAPQPAGLCKTGTQTDIDVDETNNSSGAVVIKVVDSTTTPDHLPPATAPATPVNAYGFIRFRTTVN